jgi:hypothetical protein
MVAPSGFVASGFGAMGWVLSDGWETFGNRVEKIEIERIV